MGLFGFGKKKKSEHPIDNIAWALKALEDAKRESAIAALPKSKRNLLPLERLSSTAVADMCLSSSGRGKLQKYIDEYRQKEQAKNAKWEKMWNIYENGHALEKSGDLEGALNYYRTCLYDYHAEGRIYFERPCIVLEKLKQYEEAIIICDIALLRIPVYNASALGLNELLESYRHRKQRLERKLQKAEATNNLTNR